MPTPTENQFISFWRSHVGDGVLPHSRHAARAVLDFREAGLVEPSIDERFWILTSRGADKLATADAIGYDPSAKLEPAPIALTRPCSECNGGGRKSLGVYDQGADPDPESWVEQTYTCPTCNGSRVVPRLQLRTSIEAVVQGGALDRVEDSLRRIGQMAKDAGVRVVYPLVEAGAQAERERSIDNWRIGYTPLWENDATQRPLNPNSFHVGLAPSKAADGFEQDTLARRILDTEYAPTALKWFDEPEPRTRQLQRTGATYTVRFGKFIGRKLCNVPTSYLDWIGEQEWHDEAAAKIFAAERALRTDPKTEKDTTRLPTRNPCRDMPETRSVDINEPYGYSMRELPSFRCYLQTDHLPAPRPASKRSSFDDSLHIAALALDGVDDFTFEVNDTNVSRDGIPPCGYRISYTGTAPPPAVHDALNNRIPATVALVVRRVRVLPSGDE